MTMTLNDVKDADVTYPQIIGLMASLPTRRKTLWKIFNKVKFIS